MSAHASEEDLLIWALQAGGAAPIDAWAAQTEDHIAGCASCQARADGLRASLAEEMGAEIVPLLPPARVREDLLGSIHKSQVPIATDAPGQGGLVRRIARLFAVSESRAAEIWRAAHTETAWEWPGEVSFFHFQPGGTLDSQASAGIIRLLPNAILPRHRHPGDEWVLMLAGSLREDGKGHELFPGDVLHMEKDSRHQIVCTSKEACLFAVLLQGGTPEFEW